MFWSLRSTAPLSLPRSPNPSWTTIQMSFAYVNCIHLSSFVHIQSILSRSLNLIKKSHLQAFQYDSTSTSTCAALIDRGSSDEAGSDSVACIGTSTESPSKVNWQWQTALNRSSTPSHISFSRHVLITSKHSSPISPKISQPKLNNHSDVFCICQLHSFVVICPYSIYTVSKSKPHQEITPPSFSLWLNFHKHLCSPHRQRFQWRRWLWQCSLHRHLNWIPQQSQLTVANSSQQVFNTISYIILSTCFDHFEAKLPSLPRSPNPSWTTIQMSFAYVNCIHLSSFVHIQSILSRNLNLIKKSHLKAFH